MPRSILEIVLRATGGGQVKSEIERTNRSIGSLGSAITKVAGAVGLAVSARELVQFGAEAVRVYAQTERLARATDSLAAGIGSTAEEMVKTIQAASMNTIDATTALQAANKAMLFDIVQNSGQMEELTQIAVTLGAAMGQDAAKSLDDLTTALGRQSPLILDNLGITLKLSDAHRIYAQQLGKSVEALTEEEKQAAFLNAALAAGRERVAELGGVTLDTAGSAEQLKAAWHDLTIEIGANFAPAAQQGQQGLAGLFRSMVEHSQAVRQQEQDIIAVSSSYAQYVAAMQNTERGIWSLTEAQFNLIKAQETNAVEVELMRTRMSALADSTEDVATESALATLKLYHLADAHRMVAYAALDAQYANEHYQTVMTNWTKRDPDDWLNMDPGYLGEQLGKVGQVSAGLEQLERDKLAESERNAEATASAWTSAMSDATRELRGMIEGELRPTLQEVWSPSGEGDTQRIDEWARRLATVATQGLGSEWLTQLNTQFAGMSFWEPIAAAMQAGDDAAIRRAAENLLTGPQVVQLWDKELIKSRVKQQLQEQNLREELINTIMQELAGENMTVGMGDVQAALGGGAVSVRLASGMKESMPDAIAGQNMGPMITRGIAEGMEADTDGLRGLSTVVTNGMLRFMGDEIDGVGQAMIAFLTESVARRLGVMTGGGSNTPAVTPADRAMQY